MTHRTFIEALGNGTKVAAWLSKRAGRSIDREAVYKWSANGVPYRWRPMLLEMAKERGVEPPKDLVTQ